jgi:hypothetical protein
MDFVKNACFWSKCIGFQAKNNEIGHTKTALTAKAAGFKCFLFLVAKGSIKNIELQF